MMELTSAESLIAAGLRHFPQPNLERLIAHLAAGLPMEFGPGWGDEDIPAVCGCIMGVSFSPSEADLLGVIDADWPYQPLGEFLQQFRPFSLTFSPLALARLSELVNAEVERRAAERAEASAPEPEGVLA